MTTRKASKVAIKATAGTNYIVEPHDSRAFALYDKRDDSLVGIFVYLKGAAYVAKKFTELENAVMMAAEACERGAKS